MIIAVSYKDGEIYEHFGHAEYFAIYTTNNDQTEITGKRSLRSRRPATRQLQTSWMKTVSMS